MRYLVAAGLLVAGAVTGVAAVGLHELGWGILLVVVATTVVVFTLPAGLRRLAFVLGWVVTVGWLTLPRPEGDYLVSQDWQGYGLLGLGVAILVSGLATLPRPSRTDP